MRFRLHDKWKEIRCDIVVVVKRCRLATTVVHAGDDSGFSFEFETREIFALLSHTEH